jgi:transposase-like protein
MSYSLLVSETSSVNPDTLDPAMERYRMIESYLESARNLVSVATEAEITLRTAQRWVERYRRDGLASLARKQRVDQGTREWAYVSVLRTELVDDLLQVLDRGELLPDRRRQLTGYPVGRDTDRLIDVLESEFHDGTTTALAQGNSVGLGLDESGLNCSGISVGSSIFLGGFKVQWHTLSRWFTNVEINVCLFVAFGMLLSPQLQQKRRKLRKDNLRPVDLRVTSRTESDHQMQQRLARFPMMDSGIGITAHPTGVSIAL